MKQGEFAGSLRDRIRVERLLSARDALGSASDQRQVVGDFWAAAEAIGTGDEGQAESRSAMPRWRFTLRFTDTILPGDDLIWKEHAMTILAITTAYRPTPKTLVTAEERR